MTDERGSAAAALIDLKVYPDRASASEALARHLIAAAAKAVALRGRFSLALAGGDTPATLYHLLATRFRHDVDWAHVHLLWSDERYVSPHDEASNVGAALRILLEPLEIRPDQVHAPDIALGDPAETARRYDAVVAGLGPLDLVLLGLGEDGHIASLFPGSDQLEETTRLVVAVENSPKPPPRRITMTLAALAAAREVHVLTSGASKRRAVGRALEGGRDEPITRARRRGAKLTLWTDRAASPLAGPEV